MHTGTLKREAGDAKGEVCYAADALKRPDRRWHDVCETAGMTPDLCPAHGVPDCPCGEAHLQMYGPDSEDDSLDSIDDLEDTDPDFWPGDDDGPGIADLEEP